MTFTEQILAKIGLTPGEIKVYLTGLALGPSLASHIAKEARLNRPLTYHLLELLANKGLISKSGQKHGQLFMVEPPSRLKRILERKRLELEQMEVQLEKASSELESLTTAKPIASRVRFYEGLEGIKNVAQETVKVEGNQIMALVSVENVFEILDEAFLRYWFRQREKKKIQSRSIWSKKLNIDYKANELQELRIAPKDLEISATVVMYDNKVAIFSSSKVLSVTVIENADFAKTQRSLFEKAWKVSKQ